VVVHTATEYGRGKGAVSKILESNLILPIRLIELGIEFKSICFINTDSYFNKGGSSYSNLLNYSLSKKSLLVWLKQLSNQMRVINVTLEHLYGPGDSRSKFVENLIQEIAVEHIERVQLTHGHQKRDFIYVDDVAEAFLKLIEYGCEHEFTFKSFEVGTGESVQVRDLAQLVKDISHSPSILGYGDIQYRSDEIMDSRADISALSELGWHPEIDLQEGLSRIIHGYNINIFEP
jgi:nucleoside-diphosphate-sugar epimerase